MKTGTALLVIFFVAFGWCQFGLNGKRYTEQAVAKVSIPRVVPRVPSANEGLPIDRAYGYAPMSTKLRYDNCVASLTDLGISLDSAQASCYENYLR